MESNRQPPDHQSDAHSTEPSRSQRNISLDAQTNPIWTKLNTNSDAAPNYNHVPGPRRVPYRSSELPQHNTYNHKAAMIWYQTKRKMQARPRWARPQTTKARCQPCETDLGRGRHQPEARHRDAFKDRSKTINHNWVNNHADSLPHSIHFTSHPKT